MKGRKFNEQALQHVYLRAADKGVVFYTIKDRLVYYSLSAAAARKYGIVVYAASIMFTHTHQAVQSDTLENLRKYLHVVDSSFARFYNFRYSRDGALFARTPGRAQKIAEKDKRSNILYVFNNHTEKGLCSHASEQRWSFVPYAKTDHPFSDPIDFKEASPVLRKAIKLVNRHIAKNKGLNYEELDRILPNLGRREQEQFIDYTIYHYGWVDFTASASLFKSIDDMCNALYATTGKEYDIKEDFYSSSDKQYVNMLKVVGRENILYCASNRFKEEKNKLVFEVLRYISTPQGTLQRFFHL